MTIYSVEDGTLDAFIARRMDETPEVDWDSDDAGGVFAIMFSGADEFTEEEVEECFQSAVRYYQSI